MTQESCQLPQMSRDIPLICTGTASKPSTVDRSSTDRTLPAAWSAIPESYKAPGVRQPTTAPSPTTRPPTVREKQETCREFGMVFAGEKQKSCQKRV